MRKVSGLKPSLNKYRANTGISSTTIDGVMTQKTKKNAKELGIDVREWYKILYTGNEGHIHNHNKLETDMEEKSLPGYVYGFGIPDMLFRHT